MDLDKGLLIAGVDEAGRGPLAGPVVAAAVILNPKKRIRGLADSKQLSEKERNRLFALIRKHALAWAFAHAKVAEIDQINIFQATLLAMQRAVLRLKIAPQLILVDGNKSPGFSCESRAIVDGDATEKCISAASIVAKVVRDRMMVMLDKKLPQYGFAKHKGYSTTQHFAALKTHGPSIIHRRSFAPVSQSLSLQEELLFE